MDSFIINDMTGTPCVSLSMVEYYSDIQQFTCNVKISFKEYFAVSCVSVELIDILKLKDALMMLKSGEQYYYKYKSSIDENFSIEFNRILTGVIHVECKLSNSDHSCEIGIRFDIDQSFILEMSKQLDLIIRNAL